jgi:hypothetical protein
MQQKNTIGIEATLLLAIIRSFVEWVFIIAIGACMTLLLFSFGGPNIDATLVKQGSVEIIIGLAYALVAIPTIQSRVVAPSRKLYYFIIGVSLAIATGVFLLFDGYFVFFLFLGSVATWYQITVVEHRKSVARTNTG